MYNTVRSILQRRRTNSVCSASIRNTVRNALAGGRVGLFRKGGSGQSPALTSPRRQSTPREEDRPLLYTFPSVRVMGCYLG